MKFQLTTDIQPLPNPIGYQDPILLVGSCFTENMAAKLRTYKFSVLDNPCGILFNPVSVFNSLSSILHNTAITKEALFFHLDCYHSWQHHGKFSAPTAEACVQQINASVQQAHTFLTSARVLIITLGSAWTYQLTPQAPLYQPETAVANNHKAPADWFEKKLLSAAYIVQTYTTLIHQLRQLNPGLQIMFTVSPVRHLREGLVNNNRSKAILLQAVHQLTEQVDNVYYFPAYEIVVDELRDYRFYAEDLVHPNYQATRYVWEKWVTHCLSASAQQLMQSLQDILLAFQHRPLHPGTTQHKNFLKEYAEKTRQLQSQYPYLSLSQELEYFLSDTSGD